MRLSPAAISKLKGIILADYGLELSEVEAQQVGLKIIRFVYVKEQRKLPNMYRKNHKVYNEKRSHVQ